MLNLKKKDEKTKHSATELFQQALKFFAERQIAEVADEKKRVDPLFLILEDLDTAETAKARMQRTAELKPKDMDEAISAAAKNLMAAFPGKFTLDAATEKAKKMFELAA